MKQIILISNHVHNKKKNANEGWRTELTARSAYKYFCLVCEVT